MAAGPWGSQTLRCTRRSRSRRGTAQRVRVTRAQGPVVPPHPPRRLRTGLGAELSPMSYVLSLCPRVQTLPRPLLTPAVHPSTAAVHCHWGQAQSWMLFPCVPTQLRARSQRPRLWRPERGCAPGGVSLRAVALHRPGECTGAGSASVAGASTQHPVRHGEDSPRCCKGLSTEPAGVNHDVT